MEKWSLLWLSFVKNLEIIQCTHSAHLLLNIFEGFYGVRVFLHVVLLPPLCAGSTDVWRKTVKEKAVLTTCQMMVNFNKNLPCKQRIKGGNGRPNIFQTKITF